MNHRSYNSMELLKLLNSDGWVVVRIKGSHHQLKHPIKKDLPRKTFESILKQAGIEG